MIVKELIVVLLITETLAFDSKEKFADETTDLLQGQDFHVKEKKHFSDYNNWADKKYKNYKIDAAKQFQKDYNRWSDKKFKKHSSEEFKDYMTVNEIDSNEYVDKYNKYGKTFNPNLISLKKSKENYHDKKEPKNEKPHEEHEKPGSLLHDTDVNYVNNFKKMSGDSEFITENTVNVLKSKENYQENYQNSDEKFTKRYKKDYYQNIKKLDLNPPFNNSVLMARYIVHVVDWAALGTISSRSPTNGAPFACVKATSDGVKGYGTGIPFFFMSPLDLCTQDLQKDNRVSILMTLSETEYCDDQNLDPQDPRCAKVTLSGKIKKIKPGSEEEKVAKNALFTRHPQMATWPADHNWYFSKLKIGQVILLDRYGGATHIKVKDYLENSASS